MKKFESCEKCKYRYKSDCEYPCERCVHGCVVKEYYEPMTNADRIREMSDEELAEWIHNISQDYDEEQEPTVSIYNLDTKKDMEIHDSYGDLLNWLQSEVEE